MLGNWKAAFIQGEQKQIELARKIAKEYNDIPVPFYHYYMLIAKMADELDFHDEQILLAAKDREVEGQGK